MKGNKIFSLPEPKQDSDPTTKKYVDDLQTQYIDKRGNLKFGRNIYLDNKRIFALKDPKKDYEATNKKYVDESITKRLQEVNFYHKTQQRNSMWMKLLRE